MSVGPNQTAIKKAAPATTKLPKGEFPSNIHILKGAGAADGTDARAVGASDKVASK